ncbi:hypothetical protein NA57DRAFT_80452 [Rhizodiscina lignyota]|uniref:Uncharacterized protein n=1 Tax=Rhizodiscina lignyota TaxID=1504668 RepID=A0A9P4M0W8_9PEZI|nr:hypothetical protein NA57DRAFT_80452 [Rhizodiscina lignyota]
MKLRLLVHVLPLHGRDEGGLDDRKFYLMVEPKCLFKDVLKEAEDFCSKYYACDATGFNHVIERLQWNDGDIDLNFCVEEFFHDVAPQERRIRAIQTGIDRHFNARPECSLQPMSLSVDSGEKENQAVVLVPASCGPAADKQFGRINRNQLSVVPVTLPTPPHTDAACLMSLDLTRVTRIDSQLIASSPPIQSHGFHPARGAGHRHPTIENSDNEYISIESIETTEDFNRSNAIMSNSGTIFRNPTHHTTSSLPVFSNDITSVHSTPCPDFPATRIIKAPSRKSYPGHRATKLERHKTIAGSRSAPRSRSSVSPTGVSKLYRSRISATAFIPRKWSPRRHSRFTSLRDWALPRKLKLTRTAPKNPARRFTKPTSAIDDPIIISSDSSEDDEMDETRSVEDAMAALTSEFDIPEIRVPTTQQKFNSSDNHVLLEAWAESGADESALNNETPFDADENSEEIPRGESRSYAGTETEEAHHDFNLPGYKEFTSPVYERPPPSTQNPTRQCQIIDDVASRPILDSGIVNSQVDDPSSSTDLLAADDFEVPDETNPIVVASCREASMHSCKSSRASSPPGWYNTLCERLARQHRAAKLRQQHALRAASTMRSEYLQGFCQQQQWVKVSDSENCSSDSSDNEVTLSRKIGRRDRKAKWLREANAVLHVCAEQERLRSWMEVDWVTFRNSDVKHW